MLGHALTRLIIFIMEKAGPYAWWMFGAFFLSMVLLLIPGNIVIFIAQDYSMTAAPALGLLNAYYTAANLTQILYIAVAAIAIGLQLFFLVKTLLRGARYMIFAMILSAAYLGAMGWVLNHSEFFDYAPFALEAAEDIRQIEDDTLETAIIHISPREFSDIIIGPFVPLLPYASPVQRVNGIRPGEGSGWEAFNIPLDLGFERNTDREFNEHRSISDNLAHAQLYRVTFTSHMRLVYTIEPVSIEQYRSQRPLPTPSNQGFVDDTFFGTWYLEDDPSWRMVFHENGGGLRGHEGAQQFFSWGTVNDDILSIEAEIDIGRVSSEGWDFVIEDDRLWVRNRRGRNEERVYVRDWNDAAGISNAESPPLSSAEITHGQMIENSIENDTAQTLDAESLPLLSAEITHEEMFENLIGTWVLFESDMPEIYRFDTVTLNAPDSGFIGLSSDGEVEMGDNRQRIYWMINAYMDLVISFPDAPEHRLYYIGVDLNGDSVTLFYSTFERHVEGLAPYSAVYHRVR